MSDSAGVGSFRFWFADQRWEWSDEVARMHGYEPGTVTPTTALILSHKHPDDRPVVADLLAESVRRGEPFSSRHRFIDTAGREHQVIVVADRMLDDTGAVVGTSGYYLDLTPTLTEHRRTVVNETLPELVAARAVVEQAKGVLMRIYRIRADQALRILQWRADETGVSLHALAAQLIAELDTLEPPPPGVQNAFDHLLLTVHQTGP
ncbi:PAS and ANTAR domain-containing protein [Nocardia sp. NPDC003482]|uniref:PAS and ANTAR domain-containing protein n=1 Tax=Nocardia sp. NPDC004068 TaxID=3364303 RepID=UPI00369D3E89